MWIFSRIYRTHRLNIISEENKKLNHEIACPLSDHCVMYFMYWCAIKSWNISATFYNAICFVCRTLSIMMSIYFIPWPNLIHLAKRSNNFEQSFPLCQSILHPTTSVAVSTGNLKWTRSSTLQCWLEAEIDSTIDSLKKLFVCKNIAFLLLKL